MERWWVKELREEARRNAGIITEAAHHDGVALCDEGLASLHKGQRASRGQPCKNLRWQENWVK